MPDPVNTNAPASAPALGGVSSEPANKPAAPEGPKPIKIRGVEFKSEDDAYAEIERGRQSGKLLTEAQRRLFESTKRDKDWESLVGEIKTKKDAKRLVERLGLSKDEAVELFGKYVYTEEVLPSELDPKSRRIRELEAEKAQVAEQRKKEEGEAKEREHTELTRKEEIRLKNELTKLLTEKKVPSTRLALRRVANYMAAYADVGADIPADQAVDMVMDDYRQEFGELFNEASPEQLEQFLGKQQWLMLAKKVSAWALGQTRGNMPATQSNPAPKKASTDMEEKISPQQFMQHLRGIK